MTMRLLFTLFALSLFLPANVQAQDEIGVGFIIGEPTGLTAKKWFNDRNAVDAGLAWSFSNDASLNIHADYLYHRIYHRYERRIPIYFGIGGRMVLNDDTSMGIRFPIGVGKTFIQQPIELFLEIVPVVEIVPDSDFDLNGAIGARYYFSR